MHLIWLEDEPSSIDYDFIIPLEDKYEQIITFNICQSYSTFCEKVSLVENKINLILVLDIRMLIYSRDNAPCFDKKFTISNKLSGGLDFYIQCLKENYSESNIFFVSSKPPYKLREDMNKFNIDEKNVFSKGEYKKFFTRLDEILEKNND